MTRIFILEEQNKRYMSEKPIDAARKAAEYLMQNTKLKTSRFSLRENNKIFTYIAKRSSKQIIVNKVPKKNTKQKGGTISNVPSLKLLAYQTLSKNSNSFSETNNIMFNSYVEILEEDFEKERIHKILNNIAFYSKSYLQKYIDNTKNDQYATKCIAKNYDDNNDTIMKMLWNIISDYLVIYNSQRNTQKISKFDWYTKNNEIYQANLLNNHGETYAVLCLVKIPFKDDLYSYEIKYSYDIQNIDQILNIDERNIIMTEYLLYDFFKYKKEKLDTTIKANNNVLVTIDTIILQFLSEFAFIKTNENKRYNYPVTLYDNLPDSYCTLYEYIFINDNQKIKIELELNITDAYLRIILKTK